MAHKMHLSISEIDHALCKGFPERLNADCFPPNFTPNQAD
jgi:hypothetical protein